MAIVANNSANVKTPAYKAQRFIMEHDKKNDVGDRALTPLSFNEISRDPSDGDFKKTGYELHAALTTSNAMFAVKTDKGIRYTRNGSFKVDNASGMLINSNNQAVIDSNGNNIWTKQYGTIIDDI